MHENQPGVVLRFQAKPGKGDELFELTRALHFTDDPDGPVDWALTRSNDDPDVMWAFEFYRDQESFDRHYTNPVIDDNHIKVYQLLAEEVGVDSSMRVDVHNVYSS
jgi:quinol monooxygenase YgiN